jgi:hypothetical protein
MRYHISAGNRILIKIAHDENLYFVDNDSCCRMKNKSINMRLYHKDGVHLIIELPIRRVPLGFRTSLFSVGVLVDKCASSHTRISVSWLLMDIDLTESRSRLFSAYKWHFECDTDPMCIRGSKVNGNSSAILHLPDNTNLENIIIQVGSNDCVSDVPLGFRTSLFSVGVLVDKCASSHICISVSWLLMDIDLTESRSRLFSASSSCIRT